MKNKKPLSVFENQCNDFIYVFVLINKRINIRSKFKKNISQLKQT